MRRLCVLIAVLVLSACTTVGKPISDDDINSIRVGETTPSILYAKFGKPIHASRSSNGTQILTWGYAYINPYMGKQVNKSLSVIIGADDTVDSFTVSDMGTP